MVTTSSIRSDATRTAMLALVGREGPLHRASIARELGVNPMTVTQVARELIREGLLEELDRSPSTGGRPGQLLGLVGTAGRAVGAKVSLDSLVVVDMRLDGQVVSSRIEEFDATRPDAVADLAERLRSFVKTDYIPLLGVGVCLPGVIDRPELGNVESASLGWLSVPLGRHLTGVLGVPVMVENSVKAFAFGELLYGLGRKLNTFLVATIGRGIGLATVVNRVVIRGAHGGAGEIAHVLIDPKGPLCTRGHRGCLESYAGQDGLLRAARSGGLLGDADGLEILVERADNKEPAAVSIFARAATELGRSLARSITTLDPELVILGGEGTSAWRHWDASFSQALNAALPDDWGPVNIALASWEDTSWAQGAAALVLATPFGHAGVSGSHRRQVLARLQSPTAGPAAPSSADRS